MLSRVLELVQSGWEGAEVHPELITYGTGMAIHHEILMWRSRVVVPNEFWKFSTRDALVW